jgi:hypothetical protein
VTMDSTEERGTRSSAGVTRRLILLACLALLMCGVGAFVVFRRTLDATANARRTAINTTLVFHRHLAKRDYDAAYTLLSRGCQGVVSPGGLKRLGDEWSGAIRPRSDADVLGSGVTLRGGQTLVRVDLRVRGEAGTGGLTAFLVPAGEAYKLNRFDLRVDEDLGSE